MTSSPSLPVLIVEDDPIIARALVRALQLKGESHRLLTHFSQAASSKGPFKGAIIDLHLPDGNGLDLYVHLVRQGLDVPSVFYTATTNEKEIARARQLGSYVSKSEGVVKAVDALLELIDDAFPPESETRSSAPRLPIGESCAQRQRPAAGDPEAQ